MPEKKKKRVQASSVAEAKEKLGVGKVTSVGGGKFATPETVAAGAKTSFQIGGKELTRAEFGAAKGALGGRTGGVVTPNVEAALAAQQAAIAAPIEQRKEAVIGQLGSEPLRTGLQEQILQPPSLAPETLPFTERNIEIQEQQRAFVGRLVTGKASKEEIIKEAKNLGTGLAITAGAVGGAVLAAPAIASIAARSAATKAITGATGSVPLLKKAVTGVAGAGGIYLFGKGVFNIRGDEMENLRTQLQKVVEDGERIEAAHRNGFPTGDTVELLTTMADEVVIAESRIKELGNNNLNYRVSKEYITDSHRVRSAREALLRRVLAVENTAVTGQAQLDPEALMMDIAQFE